MNNLEYKRNKAIKKEIKDFIKEQDFELYFFWEFEHGPDKGKFEIFIKTDNTLEQQERASVLVNSLLSKYGYCIYNIHLVHYI